jgi:hypothetical protein
MNSFDPLPNYKGRKYMSPICSHPILKGGTKRPIVHGITRALQNRFMSITEEPRPGALAERAQRLEERRDSFERQRRPKLTE